VYIYQKKKKKKDSCEPKNPHCWEQACNGIQNQCSGFNITTAVHNFMILLVICLSCQKLLHNFYVSGRTGSLVMLWWKVTAAMVPLSPIFYKGLILCMVVFFSWQEIVLMFYDGKNHGNHNKVQSQYTVAIYKTFLIIKMSRRVLYNVIL
jgi:hypothetical protein